MSHGLDAHLEPQRAQPARPAMLRELAEEHRAADRVVEIADQGVQPRRHIFAVRRHHLQRPRVGRGQRGGHGRRGGEARRSAAGPRAKP